MSTPWLADASVSPGPWGSPGVWQYSANAGASWSAYSGGAVAQVIGPAGTQRYRTQINIPAGTTGNWSFTASGDIWDGSCCPDWFVYYDGNPVAAGFQYNPATAVLPATPGVHTIEIWVSRSQFAGGQTRLFTVSSRYPAVAVEPIPCDCCPGSTAVACYSRDVAASELLANGNFNASTGTGAASSVGPGWTQDPGYAPCGSNIFAAPCSAGSWSYFTTNAGQVTAGAGAAIPALGGRSMAINVSNVPTAAFMRWNNVQLVQGRRYRFRCRAAIIYGPFAVALYIDNVRVAPMSVPPTSLTWTVTDVVFTWTGTTGAHSVSINSDSTVFAGNDHAFDDFSLASFPDARAFMMICDGESTWFDVDTGAELTATERATMRDCPTDRTFAPVAIEPHVRVMSISWGIPLPAAADEENGDFTPAFMSSVGAVSTNPGFWHPPYPTPPFNPAPCDAGALMEFDWTGAPTTSVTWTYRRDPNSDSPAISGNTYYWSAPGLGITNFDFGVRPMGQLGVGQSVDSAEVGGYKARLTLVSVGNPSGLTNNLAMFENTGCGAGRMHAHPNNTFSDQPQTYRIEFFQLR